MQTDATPTWGFRFRPREWIRLAPLVRNNPGDVKLGAQVFFSLGGHDEEPTYRRFLKTATGRRMIRHTISYPKLFSDFPALRALPAGTLGRTYVRELDERGIDPLDLARLTRTAYVGRSFSPHHAYVRDKVVEAHDLFHTLTGYGVDISGEGGVLAFTFGQTGNKGWAMLVFLNALTTFKTFRFDSLAVAWRGYLRGRRARYLPAVDDWDRLLRLPLEDARAELRISPLLPYRPMALEEAFSGAVADAS